MSRIVLIELLASSIFIFFFFNDTATTEIYTLSLHDALPISFGKPRTVPLDLGEEPDFILGEFTQHFLRIAVAGRLGAGEELGQADVHGFSDLGQSFERRNRVTVFHAGEIATQQPGSAFDVSLGEPALAPVAANDFADVHLGFFFWHPLSSPVFRVSYVAVLRRASTN